MILDVEFEDSESEIVSLFIVIASKTMRPDADLTARCKYAGKLITFEPVSKHARVPDFKGISVSPILNDFTGLQ